MYKSKRIFIFKRFYLFYLLCTMYHGTMVLPSASSLVIGQHLFQQTVRREIRHSTFLVSCPAGLFRP
jgi:hypothetical protein